MATVGFTTDCVVVDFGEPSLLRSFFSTICILLESGKWGDRFPRIMNELYWQDDGVPFLHLHEFWNELRTVQNELAEYSSEFIVWDWERRGNHPSN